MLILQCIVCGDFVITEDKRVCLYVKNVSHCAVNILAACIASGRDYHFSCQPIRLDS